MIHISIYYGGPLSNANPYDGVSFQGPGIQCYYMMIRRKLKTLNELNDLSGEERDLLNGQWRRCKWWAICIIWWEVLPWAQKRESEPCPILN